MGSGIEYRYSNVPECEEPEALPEQLLARGNTLPYQKASATATKPGWGRACRAAIAAVVLVLIASAGFILGSIATKMTLSRADSERHIEHCGETPARARANGCRYDPMIQMWVPAACYDEEHSEMYLSTYKWKWYYDFDAQHEMPDEVIRRGEHKVAFMADDYHRRHCAYVWEVSARALQQQRPMVDEWLSYKHVRHCNGILLAPSWNSTKHPIAVEARTRYGRCAPYRVWVHEMPE